MADKLWGLRRFDYFFLAVSIISILPCLLPIDLHISNSTLQKTLHDIPTKFSFVASIALSLPMMIDIILDLFCPLKLDNINLLAKFMLITGLMLPLVILINENPSTYYILMITQRILWYVTSIFRVLNYILLGKALRSP